MRYGPTNENAMHSFCKRADVCASACDIQGASEICDPYTAHEDEDAAGIFAKMRLYVLILRLTQGLSSRLNTSSREFVPAFAFAAQILLLGDTLTKKRHANLY